MSDEYKKFTLEFLDELENTREKYDSLNDKDFSKTYSNWEKFFVLSPPGMPIKLTDSHNFFIVSTNEWLVTWRPLV